MHILQNLDTDSRKMHMLHMSMPKANSALAAQIWANSHLKNLGSLVEP